MVWRDGTAANLGRGQDPDEPAFSHLREVDYCSAASLMLLAELFRNLGGFDPVYSPAYYEDTDLCMRVRKAGYKVYCQPLARVIHIEGGTAGRDPTRGFKRYQTINHATFVRRWADTLQNHFQGDKFNAYTSQLGGAKRVLVVDYRLPNENADAGSIMTLEFIRLFRALGYQSFRRAMLDIGTRSARHGSGAHWSSGNPRTIFRVHGGLSACVW